MQVSSETPAEGLRFAARVNWSDGECGDWREKLTVRFDARGPVAQGLLSYGQSTDPASPHANDQLRRFSRGEWPALPFHAEDIAKARIGEVLTLVRP